MCMLGVMGVVIVYGAYFLWDKIYDYFVMN